LKLLRLETTGIMFSDATLRDINVVLCYVLSQYRVSIEQYVGLYGKLWEVFFTKILITS
jgi:hypothetical protein